MRLIRPGTAVGATLGVVMILLTACTSAQDAALPQCPKATILEGTSTLARFRDGPGRDLTDVDFTAVIERLNGSCIYDVDDSGAGILNMDVQLEMRVDRGPANRDHKAKFEYFVSIIDSGGNVMTKETFPFRIEFDGNKTTSRDSDAPVTMSIPVTAEQDSRDFTVFVGFQLTPKEIRYNRDISRPGKS